MKTFLKHEFTIEMVLIVLLLLIFTTYIYSEDRVFSTMFIVDFFILALFQYTCNIAKFFSKKFIKTESRSFYIYAATFVVITFLLYLVSDLLNAETLVNFLGAIGISWIILSPILIFLSLQISWFDSKNKMDSKIRF